MITTMMTMMMIMLHIYKVTYVNQAIYIYENSLNLCSSKWPCEVGRAGITSFILTDVKSGSKKVRGVSGDM